jgi:dehydrogenase/reductase SDR family protein 12
VPSPRTLLARSVDEALEATIVASWSRLGFLARRAASATRDLPRLDNKEVVVTGASSGLGAAAARQLAALGAEVVLVGRDRDRLKQIADQTGGHPIPCDLVERDQIDDLATQLAGRGTGIDAIVHSAGALFPQRKQDPDGTEMTLAVHLLAPFRLTERLHDQGIAPAVSVLVSSGGMYTQQFDLDRLEMPEQGYRGAVAYARAKRAQLILADGWGRRYGIRSYSMHPGWAATPGVGAGLPNFARLGPLLRTADEGADTMTWLVAEGLGPTPPAEGFYFDRRLRGQYYRPGTHPVDGQERALWDWLEARK